MSNQACAQTKIITNNPKIKESALFGAGDEFCETDAKGIIIRCRDLVHRGWSFVTHPMAGSLKPGENPFRTVIMCKSDSTLDLRSLSIVESAIEAFGKFVVRWPQLLDETVLDERLLKIRDDFMAIDQSLITNRIGNSSYGG